MGIGDTSFTSELGLKYFIQSEDYPMGIGDWLSRAQARQRSYIVGRLPNGDWRPPHKVGFPLRELVGRLPNGDWRLSSSVIRIGRFVSKSENYPMGIGDILSPRRWGATSSVGELPNGDWRLIRTPPACILSFLVGRLPNGDS